MIRDKARMHLVLVCHFSMKPGLLLTCLALGLFTALPETVGPLEPEASMPGS